MSKLHSLVIALFLAISLLAPTVALADKPDPNEKSKGQAKQEERQDHPAGEPDTDHQTGGPDDSSADNNPSDSDRHNNDDEHSRGPNRPQAPSAGAAAHSNCDNNGFDGCGSTPEPPVVTPNPSPAPEVTPTPSVPVVTPTPTLIPPVTPEVPSTTTPVPSTGTSTTPEVGEPGPGGQPVITTTVEIPFDVPDAGGCPVVEECDVCEKLDTIIEQNTRIERNQAVIMALLSRIVAAIESLLS